MASNATVVALADATPATVRAARRVVVVAAAACSTSCLPLCRREQQLTIAALAATALLLPRRALLERLSRPSASSNVMVFTSQNCSIPATAVYR